MVISNKEALMKTTQISIQEGSMDQKDRFQQENRDSAIAFLAIYLPGQIAGALI